MVTLSNVDGRYCYICDFTRMCLKKIQILVDYCKDYGMVINEKKTKFMAFNGTDTSKEPLYVESNDARIKCRIEHCDTYVYLGSIFTSDGKIKTAHRR